MITSMQMYWITRLSYLAKFFEISGSFCGLLGIISLGIICISNAEGELKNKKWWLMPKILIPSAALFLFISSFIPTTKEMAAILIVPKLTNAIAENEEIQKLPNNLMGLANEWIEELKPKTEAK
jgi:hypothetical protein